MGAASVILWRDATAGARLIGTPWMDQSGEAVNRSGYGSRFVEVALSTERAERQLAAILAADIAGYSWLGSVSV